MAKQHYFFYHNTLAFGFTFRSLLLVTCNVYMFFSIISALLLGFTCPFHLHLHQRRICTIMIIIISLSVLFIIFVYLFIYLFVYLLIVNLQFVSRLVYIVRYLFCVS